MSSGRRFADIVCCAAVALVATGCAVADPQITATRSRQIDDEPLIPDDTDGPTPATTVPIVEGIIDFGSRKPPQAHDGFLTGAVVDVVAFMNELYPELYGAPYPPLEGGIFAAYPERPEDEVIPGCGTQVTVYEDVAGNAFYCSLGDFMVYDDLLLRDLVDELGLSGVGIVMAHEFGHSIQSRIGEFDQPTILMEQQADCFAGAWTARVARGESPSLQFDDTDVKAGLIAMIQVRDPVETSGTNDPNAHGTGFDRVGAFQEGFKDGAIACRPYFEEPRPLIGIPFDFTDENAGNLPYVDDTPDPTNGPADIITLIPADLNRYWELQATNRGGTFTAPTMVRFTDDQPPTCDGVPPEAIPDNVVFCAATNEVLISDELAFRLSDDPLTGDMSVGYLISQAYSESIQIQVGSALTGEARVLTSDCLTGSWVADIVPRQGETFPLVLSAGDLDEAIITAIARSDETSTTDELGSAFEKIDAFRQGVLGGIAACPVG